MPAPCMVDTAEIRAPHAFTPAPADAAHLVSLLDEDGSLSALSGKGRLTIDPACTRLLMEGPVMALSR